MKTGEVESARRLPSTPTGTRIKPGMTGWAAIHGSRGSLHDPAEAASGGSRSMLTYIARQSVWLDLVDHW